MILPYIKYKYLYILIRGLVMLKKFCFISDTHCKHKKLNMNLEGVDFLIVTGDFTSVGREHEVHNFNKWIGKLGMPKERVVVVCGNHDFWFERMSKHATKSDGKNVHLVCHNFTYLQEEAYEYDGVKFYGAPHQPYFGGWAFNVHRGEPIKKIWDKIPEDTDVLLTHGPPWGILDKNQFGLACGCEELTKRCDELNLKVHAFGHIHEDGGVKEKNGTIYVNASMLDVNYQPTREPIILDIEI
jgi:Icc-related predicted phosphoesterase